MKDRGAVRERAIGDDNTNTSYEGPGPSRGVPFAPISTTIVCRLVGRNPSTVAVGLGVDRRPVEHNAKLDQPEAKLSEAPYESGSVMHLYPGTRARDREQSSLRLH